MSGGERATRPAFRHLAQLLEKQEVEAAKQHCTELLTAGERPGPLLTLLAHEPFDVVHVLFQADHGARREALELAITERHPALRVVFHAVSLSDPRHYAELYGAVREICERVRAAHGEAGVEYAVLLSPGTAQMHATWVLLTQTGLFPATTYQTTEVPDRPAVEAVRIPFNLDLEVLAPIVEPLRAELASLSLERASAAAGFRDIVHTSEVMREVINLALRVARLNVTTLITGPSGTGKELLARGLHFASPRAKHPFVAINCGALPETLIESELFGYEKGAFTGAGQRRAGFFEQASGGTVFLDEIGELPLALQPRLLRVLQEGEVRRLGAQTDTQVDVRVIAATNRDLGQMVEERTFREDLFFRLTGLTLRLPPLCERAEDIVPLAQHFLAAANKERATQEPSLPPCTLAPEALRYLVAIPWPGNVRQLAAVVRQTVLLAEQPRIGAAELQEVLAQGRAPQPPTGSPLALVEQEGFCLNDHLAEIERALIVHACELSKTLAEASRRLGYANYQTLSQRLEKHGLDKRTFFG